MKRTYLYIIIMGLLIVAAVLGVWYLQNSHKPYTGKLESITVGMPPLPEASAQVIIADNQHYFSDNGLAVSIKNYETGSASVEHMLKGDNDIAMASEFVIVRHGFEQDNISGIGTIAKTENQYFIIGRTDRGIQKITDLRGKTIAVPRGTAGEFYLGRFLDLHSISLKDVTVIDVPPPQTAEVIENGTADAVLIWRPFADTIKDQLGSNGISWSAESGQLGYWNAICRNGWITQNPDLIDRFLRSLDKAAGYITHNPEKAKTIVRERLQADPQYVNSSWHDIGFSLSLDQSLITAMEDEGRWMINNNLTDKKAIPDYRDYLNTGSLEKLKPEAVNIIG